MFGSSQWMYSSGPASFYDHQIDGSLRFNASDSAYLSRTPSAGDRQKFTFSAWMKLGDFDNWPQSEGYIFSVASGSDNTNNFYFKQLDSGQLRVTAYSVNWRGTTALYRDPSAWYHVVLACDSTQGTAQNRIRLYINGEEVTSWSINNAPSQNQNFAINMAAEHRINQHPPGYDYPWGGYMAEVNFIDGQQLSPSSFGETKSGVWIPKAYSGSYGSNGFYLKFAGNANDSSGNSNNWTANNITSDDYVSDSPTDNFATLNPLWNSVQQTYAEGNLKTSSGSTHSPAVSTIGVSSGKWYVEGKALSSSTTKWSAGILDTAINYRKVSGTNYIPGQNPTNVYTNGDAINYYASGNDIYKNGSQVVSNAFSSALTTNDILQIAFDADAGEIWYGINNSWNNGTGTQGTFDPDSPDTTFTVQESMLVHFTGENNVWLVNFGQSDFAYTPPSGFNALSTANLTIAESVDPNEENSPQDYFSTILYSGNGSSRSITGVGFEPSLTWIKSRNHGHNPELYQAVHGATQMWMTSYVNSDTTRSDGLTSFNSDGFSLGTSIYTNQNGLNFVAWNWKANGAGSSNSTGSITATVSADPNSGVSIMKWTGTGASGNIAHGLNSAPKFLINKAFYGSNSGYTAYWNIWGNGMSITKRVLFSSDAQLDAQSGWGDTEPSDTLVYLGSKDELNGSNGNFMMIAFAPVEGFSKFSSYVGNGSTDGTFVYTGFRVAFVLVKKITAAENWSTADTTRSPFNVSQNGLQPGTANAENTTSGFAIDFLSNGFKPRSGAGQWNDNNATYIYAAFAENPFKYANAR